MENGKPKMEKEFDQLKSLLKGTWKGEGLQNFLRSKIPVKPKPGHLRLMKIKMPFITNKKHGIKITHGIMVKLFFGIPDLYY
jgi:hypothetical protein